MKNIKKTLSLIGVLIMSSMSLAQTVTYEDVQAGKHESGKINSYESVSGKTYEVGDTIYFNEPSAKGTYVSSQKMDVTAKPQPMGEEENGKYAVINSIKISGSKSDGFMVGFVAKGEGINENYIIFIDFAEQSDEIKNK